MTPAEEGHPRVRWVREVRRHHEGTFLLGGRALPVRFIIDGASGRLVMPVEKWVLDHPEGVLYLPEERADSLQLLLDVLEEAPSGAAEDRWCAYHGEPRQSIWIAASIAGVRRESEVCDDDVRPINALRGCECAMLKELNRHKGALATVCARLAGVGVQDACAVGVDPHGIDIRARFGIVRAEFPGEVCRPGEEESGVECPERVGEAIRAMLSGAGA